MPGRAPTLGPQSVQLFGWLLPSERQLFPNTTWHRGNDFSNLLFLPLNTNSFHFPEKHCMVCCSASWSLWHVERVISPSGCNCHHKAFNKFKKQHQDQGTNGRRDELLTIFDYLIQLEPFLIAKMPKHSQSHSYSTQTNHQSSPKFWLLPTIKTSQLHIKWCQGKHCFSSSSPTLLGIQLHATVVFFF